MTDGGTDGEFLQESDYKYLLEDIIERNDVAALNRYIEEYPRSVFAPSEMVMDDPFWIAAANGSTDVLRVLLDLCKADPLHTQALDTRRFSLLDAACLNAQHETARFLLDRDPPLGMTYARDRHGGWALLSAAESLTSINSDKGKRSTDIPRNWLQDHIARSEDLMYMLLDRGASVRDAVQIHRFTDDDKTKEQPQLQQWPLIKTVLGKAVLRASYKLVSRLIAQGADVHARQYGWGPGFSGEGQEVTALHIGSNYWNTEGIQALMDNRGCEFNLADMVSVRDSIGRLPLHWAAAGPEWFDEDGLSEDEIASRMIDTFKLLIEINPGTINIQDEKGATALYYVVKSHARCGSTRHFEKAIRFLCGKGADASLQDSNRQNVLHMLAFFSVGAEPINPVILDILVTYGAKVNDTDMDGNTALHVMARNLRQVNLARVLVRHGANVHAVNTRGETPLHKAMGARLLSRQTRKGKLDEMTLEKQIKGHDEMLKILQEAGGSMDKPNAANQTPRQLLEETRESWRKTEEAKRRLPGERSPLRSTIYIYD